MPTPDSFSYTAEIPVRFRDIDPMNHVNNALYVTYVEQARAEYYEDVVGTTLGEADTVLVHLTMDYLEPIDLGDVVTVSMRTDSLGESSIPMAYELRVNETVVATAETVQVTIDRATGDAEPIPNDWRERIETYEAEHR